MCLNKDHVEENWISLILRIAIGMAFTASLSDLVSKAALFHSAAQVVPGRKRPAAMVAGDDGRQFLKVLLQQRFIAEHQSRALHHWGA